MSENNDDENKAPRSDGCKITILGAGPAGIAAAYTLANSSRAQINVIERAPVAAAIQRRLQSKVCSAIMVHTGSTRLLIQKCWPM